MHIQLELRAYRRKPIPLISLGPTSLRIRKKTFRLLADSLQNRTSGENRQVSSVSPNVAISIPVITNTPKCKTQKPLTPGSQPTKCFPPLRAQRRYRR
ncbi:hypothetical protein M431DRAFT_308263 [Trichoderma harzianum CBS 226.95]|uniref:Uncharacterized protein n=1 Tax=Trichoderma harzianum CBS 226.95 TaxID=983964 RepID=A0A2T4ARC6_TRIHA|nr:hypothetical protein M431DRAFT_308263 [Trichoderma harzianum CBS 226.95]PTB59590.1 hypothetical protein M431DRAFT_308263 [Trichoderma harzianum CBS 226.95]